MSTFTKTGDDESDFWHLDGSATFSIFPANTVPMFNRDLPIRLHVGNLTYGQVHTEKHWNFKTAGNRTVPQLIHFKLGQSGNVYATEKEKKVKITMGITPGGLMVMEYRYQKIEERLDEYLSVITFYGPQRKVDGTIIGRYQGRPRPVLIPVVAVAAPADYANESDADRLARK